MRTRVFAALTIILLIDPALAQQGDRKLTVINGTHDAIEYFYFAGCGGGDWGKDRLGSKEIIKPGERRLFSMKGDCCFDLRAKLQSGASRQKLSADVCREPDWTVR